ncbi:hypothetical protein HYW75_05095 [Candidatus Pacearchaeota archaeon]|nr:hypothetical protein [Candidatus Pacearchaeota archaeon]
MKSVFIFITMIIALALIMSYAIFNAFVINEKSEYKIYYLSPYGNDTHQGTIEKPWRSIERAFNNSYLDFIDKGDTLYLREGIYRIDQPSFDNVMKSRILAGTKENPIIISGFPGERAKIYLSENISGWKYYNNNKPRADIYYFNWRNYLEKIHPWFLRGMGEFSKPQGVFIDGFLPIGLNQVNSNKTAMNFKPFFTRPKSNRENQYDMLPGDFYYESEKNSVDFGKIFIRLPNRDNPNDKRIEVSLDYIFYFVTNWTIISNLTILYGNDVGWASLTVSGDNNIIENIESSYNSFAGIDGICNNCILRNSIFKYNGDLGSAFRGKNAVYEKNTFENNNWKNFDSSWSCGDIKLIDNYQNIIVNMTIRDSKFASAVNCSSLWLDYIYGGHLIENNIFSYTRAPINIELVNGSGTSPTIIKNNIFAHIDNPGRKYHEWHSAIHIASSHYTYVYNNLIYDTPAGVSILGFDIPEEPIRRYGSNNRVFNNIFVNVTAPLLIVGIVGDISVTNTSSDFNLFYGGGRPLYKSEGELNDGSRFMFCNLVGDCTYSLSEWNKRGFDLHSFIKIDPVIKERDALLFSYSNSSPIIDNGIFIQDVIKDIIGVSRPQGRNYDIGPFEYVFQNNSTISRPSGKIVIENFNDTNKNNKLEEDENIKYNLPSAIPIKPHCSSNWVCQWYECINEKQIYSCRDIKGCDNEIRKKQERKCNNVETQEEATYDKKTEDNLIKNLKNYIKSHSEYIERGRILAIIILSIWLFIVLIKIIKKRVPRV